MRVISVVAAEVEVGNKEADLEEAGNRAAAAEVSVGSRLQLVGAGSKCQKVVEVVGSKVEVEEAAAGNRGAVEVGNKEAAVGEAAVGNKELGAMPEARRSSS